MTARHIKRDGKAKPDARAAVLIARGVQAHKGLQGALAGRGLDPRPVVFNRQDHGTLKQAQAQLGLVAIAQSI